MRRTLLVLVVLAGMAAMTGSAGADHEWRRWAKGAVINFQDRTGNPTVQSNIQEAAADWNRAGANFTISYSVGPADNACSHYETGKVKFCIGELDYGQAVTYISPFWGDITAANIIIEPQVAHSPFGPMHEGGHALGLWHSCVYSVMYMGGSYCNNAPTNWSLQARTPTQHDKDALVSLYGTRPVSCSAYACA